MMNMRNFFTQLLAYLGAFVFFSGALIGFSQHFDFFNWPWRFFLTLGLGLIFYYLGVLINFRDKFSSVKFISDILFLISAALFFLGLQLILIFFYFSPESPAVQGLVAGLLALNYGLAYLFLRRNVFVFLIIFLVSYLISILGFHWVAGFFSTYTQQIFPIYLMLFLGFLYCVLGYIFYKTACEVLSPALYFFGAGLFLIAVPILGQCYDGHELLWDFVLLGSVLLGFAFSFLPRVKSKIVLTWSAIFLVINIYVISLAYLHNTAWSWILMGLGVILILVGYLYWILIKKISSKIN